MPEQPNRLDFGDKLYNELVAYLRDGRGKTQPRTSVLKRKVETYHITLKGNDLFIEAFKVVRKEKINETLSQIIERGFPALSPARLYYEVLRRKLLGISKKACADFLSEYETYQLRKAQPKTSVIRPITARGINIRWQVDLMDFSHAPSRNFNYILSAIDVFSKKISLEAITTKSSVSTSKAIIRVLARRGEKPHLIQTDSGSEFTDQFLATLTKLGIKHVASSGYHPTSQSHVERSNGTIKQILVRLMGQKNEGFGNWSNYVPQTEDLYNNMLHSTIQKRPNAVKEEDQTAISKRIKQRADESLSKRYNYQELKAGDKVRLRLTNRTPDQVRKKILWSEELYNVKNVQKDGFVLLEEGKKVPRGNLLAVGRVRKAEKPERAERVTRAKEEAAKITKPHRVIKPSTGLLESIASQPASRKEFKVSKIMKHRGPASRREFLVYWEGYPHSQDTWEPWKNVHNLAAYDDYLKKHPSLSK